MASGKYRRMEKSLVSNEYAVLRILLRDVRRRAGITQVELAERIDDTQSTISKFERGERRIDLIQLRTICRALNLSLASFVEELEQRLDKSPQSSRPSRR